jgi:tetratricopeptide (TPR) repeat protein
MTTLMKWANRMTDQLTFIQLKPGISLGIKNYSVPAEGLYVPLLTIELAGRIQQSAIDKVVTVPAILRGILFLLGADPEFKHKDDYKSLISEIPELTKSTATESVKEFERERDFEEAAIIMRGYHQLFPDDDQAAIMLGALYVRIAGSQKRQQTTLEKTMMMEALQILESKYPQNEDNVLMLFYLGTVYQWQKSYQKANKMWTQALQVAKGKNEKRLINKKLTEIEHLVRYEEGYQLILRGQANEGLAVLQPILDDMPDWWNLHFFIAMGFQQKSEWDEAIFHFGKVLEIRGFHLQTAIELSEIYMAKGEKQKSVHWMEEAMLQKPDNAELMCRMALLKALTGSRTEAYELLESATDTGGDSEMLESVKKQIDSICGNDEEFS